MFIYREVGTIIRSLGCCPSEAEILDMLAEVGSMLASHHSMFDSHHSSVRNKTDTVTCPRGNLRVF